MWRPKLTKSIFLRWMHRALELLKPTVRDAGPCVEVPPAGLDLPAPFLEPGGFAARSRALVRDADLYVDAFVRSAPAEVASMIVAAGVALCRRFESRRRRRGR